MEAFEQTATLTWFICKVDLPQVVQAGVASWELLVKLLVVKFISVITEVIWRQGIIDFK